MTDKTLEELTAWPKTEGEVTVDGMLRTIGFGAQQMHLRHWELVRAKKLADGSQFLGSPSHMLMIEMELSAVGFMGAIRALNEVSPEAALAFVRDHWCMCDAGDSTGEFLWEWISAAGLNPELIKLPPQPPQAT